MTTAWKSYEEVATHLLDQFAAELGLQRVEKGQQLRGGRSGTTWRIDAKGICEDGVGFVLVECRRYTTQKQKQEHIAALAYRITDTGGEGGIIVSPLGLQEGAAKVASAENVVDVRIDPDSTTLDYVLKFLERTMVGASVRGDALAGDCFDAEVDRKNGD